MQSKISLTHYGCSGNSYEKPQKIINVHRFTQVDLRQEKEETYENYRKNRSFLDDVEFSIDNSTKIEKNYFTPTKLQFVRRSIDAEPLPVKADSQIFQPEILPLENSPQFANLNKSVENLPPRSKTPDLIASNCFNNLFDSSEEISQMRKSPNKQRTDQNSILIRNSPIITRDNSFSMEQNMQKPSPRFYAENTKESIRKRLDALILKQREFVKEIQNANNPRLQKHHTKPVKYEKMLLEQKRIEQERKKLEQEYKKVLSQPNYDASHPKINNSQKKINKNYKVSNKNTDKSKLLEKTEKELEKIVNIRKQNAKKLIEVLEQKISRVNNTIKKK